MMTYQHPSPVLIPIIMPFSEVDTRVAVESRRVTYSGSGRKKSPSLGSTELTLMRRGWRRIQYLCTYRFLLNRTPKTFINNLGRDISDTSEDPLSAVTYSEPTTTFFSSSPLQYLPPSNTHNQLRISIKGQVTSSNDRRRRPLEPLKARTLN